MLRRWVLASLMTWLLLTTTSALAASQSTNYKIDEDFVGNGGLTNESSTNFQASESIGDIGVGTSSSTNFQVNVGYTTTADPALTFIITGTNPNFGSLSAGLINSATSTFRVINYTSYGYVVVIAGTTPSNDGYTIPALTSTTTATPGNEEYGINVVANTGFGANPAQVPDSSWSYGVAQGPDYDQTNKFKFVSGDTIASAPKSSGATDFTISHILDVKPLSHGGNYTANHELICIGTY